MSSNNQDIISIDNQSEEPKEIIMAHQSGRKNQRIQINSLDSLLILMEEGSSSTMKQKKDSLSPPKKFGKFSLKANNSISGNQPSSDVESITQMYSMNHSSLELYKSKKERQKIDQFELGMEMNQEQKSDSPQKLHKKNKKLPISQIISLLCPPQELWQKSYQFLNKQYSQLQKQTHTSLLISTVRQFLLNPLPVTQDSYMRYIFEIHLYKYTFTFHTCYEFYMRNSEGDMIHLARSEKDSLTVSSSHLLYATNPQKSGDKEFVGKLKYNTVKSEYNLYDVDQKQHPNQTRRLLASGFYQKPIGDQRQIKFYIPKVQFLHNDFIKSETKKNMVSFYNENESPIYRQIEMLRTAPIPKQNEAKVRSQLELKSEGRRILVVDEQGHQKFYMGKKQNDRYVILGAGGLTPLQIFTLAILNLDH